MPAKVMLVHQTAPLNPPEEAHVGSAVSLLRLIFTVLRLGFSRFLLFLFLYNSVISRLQREREHAGVSAHANRWWKAAALSEVPPLSFFSFFFFFFRRQTHMSDSTQFIRVCAHVECQREESGAALLRFSTSLLPATDLRRAAPRLDSTRLGRSSRLTQAVGKRWFRVAIVSDDETPIRER